MSSSPANNYSCKYCSLTHYCSSQCRVNASHIHRLECKLLDAVCEIATECSVDVDLMRLLLRTVCTRSLNHAAFQDQVENMAHHRDRFEPKWIEAVQSAASRVESLLPNPLKRHNLTSRMLLEICCRVNINAHGLSSRSADTNVAVALLKRIAMTNHSCSPNCVCLNVGTEMRVCAIRDISKDEEITYSYIDIYQSREARQIELKATKFFDCHCARCDSVLADSIDHQISGIRCPSCQQGILVDLKCDSDSCQHSLSECEFADLQEPMQKLFSSAEQLYAQRRPTAAKEQFEAFLSEYGSQLDDLHWWILTANVRCTMCYYSLDAYDDAIKCCCAVIDRLTRVLGEYHPEVANYYDLLHTLHKSAGHTEQASTAQARQQKIMHLLKKQ
jgi:SET domain